MVKNLVVNRGFNSAARSSSLGCGWRDAEDQGWFQFSSVSQVYFHERLHEWDYFKCPNSELKRSRPAVMLKLNIIVTSYVRTHDISALSCNVSVFVFGWQCTIVKTL